jgi:wyosine [tRNA(Phe)-imidazoG37] synthetase (radical SAM superfamily)
MLAGDNSTNAGAAMNQYTYGPVPSRRLGRSLGVDIVPMKTCSLNCVYCQLRPTERTTRERAEYAPVDEVVEEVCRVLADGCAPDYVTLGGSGEPTLHAAFGRVAEGVRACTETPIALITNGTMFHLPEVRAQCGAIDLVLPSLDAGDEETYRLMNRPDPELSLAMLVDGLAALREEFEGEIWLEVFLVEGVNTADDQLRAMRRCIERVRPDRVQLNTAVRPAAEAYVQPAPPHVMEHAREVLGPQAEIIAGGPLPEPGEGARARQEEVLQMLRRRPCTAEDVAEGLGVHVHEAIKHINKLLAEHRIRLRQRLYQTYYEAAEE